MFNIRTIASLIAFLAMTTLFFSQNVTGHNENDPPQHTHTYPNEYGICFTTGFSVSEDVNGDCTTITTCIALVAIASKACTHGVWQPPPPQHDCGCAATNCGYTSCGCYSGSYNGGLSQCPCEDSCS